MQTTEIALSRLVENKENPRTITEGQFSKLVQSILVFPKMMELRPIVIDETFTALGGNMRLKALCHIVGMDADSLELALSKEQRLTDAERNLLIDYWTRWQKKPTAITASVSDLTEAQKREFIIKDNVAFGNWDYNELANKWNVESLNNWGVMVWNPSATSFGGTPQTGASGHASSNNVDFAGQLPPEIDGEDLAPADLPKIQGSDETATERIIITYTKEQEPYLAALLGITSIDKVLYTLDELKERNGSEM